MVSFAAVRKKHEKTVDKREVLVSTEIPVEYIDPAAIDLTSLVNKLLNTTQMGSQQLFSLLSVTSHSSLALHKLTILVYNISNSRTIETTLFPLRYCYCLSNKSSDLTDFTAILLDVMGNSTSYLHEIFKSSSILSVSQRNDSDCIYICVMAGKTDRELLPLWETESAKPLFNQTITASVHREWYRLPTSSSTSWLPKPSVVETTRVPPTSGSNPADSTTSRPSTTERGTVGSSSTASRTVSLAASAESILKDAGCPWKRLVFAGTGAEIARPTAATATGALSTTISEPKLQPCVLELCKFFSQCLCRGYAKAGTVSYCVDNHPWYVQYTSEVCRRVKRVSFSKSLKQKCLAGMCAKP
ncbi:uncharacterized protein hhla1 [Scleropages formosus]|uniref:uncharacterized protein hhla1 n=1 Tax=Scleropages formosus TaxID=113540 RepID=UPI0008790327|nr:HERV-H LTR-associating protein 1 [Scleropages formosus]